MLFHRINGNICLHLIVIGFANSNDGQQCHAISKICVLLTVRNGNENGCWAVGVNYNYQKTLTLEGVEWDGRKSGEQLRENAILWTLL